MKIEGFAWCECQKSVFIRVKEKVHMFPIKEERELATLVWIFRNLAETYGFDIGLVGKCSGCDPSLRN